MTTPDHPNDIPPQTLLHYAVGAPTPLRLEEINANSEILQHTITTPFGIVGRGAECDIRVADAAVAFRHLYLQPIGSRVACLDLWTAAGIEWLEGPDFNGWLSPQHIFRVGRSIFRLVDDHWLADDSLKSPTSFRPREDRAADYGSLATVELELVNTSAKGRRWPINRIITLLGRDKRCRISVGDERVSRVHCSLLLLPSGLWMVDLLGKGGVQVKGEPARCALLSDGTELVVGPYHLRARYTEPAPAVHGFETHGMDQSPAGSQLPVSGGPGHSDSEHDHAEPVEEVAEAASSLHVHGEQLFVTRQNRLFVVEGFEDTMIVRPRGDGRGFFYQEIHTESGRVNDVITSRRFTHTVVDFSDSEGMGKIALDALTQICRATLGRVTFCNASPEIYEELERSGLARIWHHYLTLDDAFLAVHVEPETENN